MDTSITLGFDDHIIVNGVEGWIDAFLEDDLGVIDTNNKFRRFPWLEIKSFEKLAEALPDQLTRDTLDYYIEFARKQVEQTRL